MEARDFDPISPTAHVTACLREHYLASNSFGRMIPALAGSRQVYEQVGGRGNEEEFSLFLATRFQLGSMKIFEQGINNVLEIAAGMSSRGMDVVRHNDKAIYIETDLPAQIERKREVLGKIKSFPAFNKPYSPRYFERLSLQSLDITDADNLRNVAAGFPAGPVGIISEGVLPYLYKEDIEKAVVNIRELLAERGGIWFTDIATRQGLEKPIFQEEASVNILRRLYEISNTDRSNLAFENGKEAVGFFQKSGFEVERVSAEDLYIHRLIASRRGLSPKRIEEITKLKIYLALRVA